MDNRIFNVNGQSKDDLIEVLRLVFRQHGDNTKCSGWFFDEQKGLVLCWGTSEMDVRIIELPNKLTASDCAPIVWSWLSSESAKSMKLTGEDSNYQHDGSNVCGWRVYCETWGKVADVSSAICAITPAFMWYGK